MKKYYLYISLFLAQFFFLPVFLDSNIAAKFFVFTIAISLFSVVFSIDSINRRSLIFLLVTASLVAVNVLNAYNFPSAFIAGGVFLLFVFWGVIIVPDLYPKGLDSLFFVIFLLFIQIVTSLGLYQYFTYCLVGKSKVPLIPYLLPPSTSMRVTGIYGQPNIFALLLVVGIIIHIYVIFENDEFLNFKNKTFNFIKYIPFLTTVFVFFLTNSRAGLLAFLFSLLLILAFYYKKGYLLGDKDFAIKSTILVFYIFSAYVLSILANKYFGLGLGRGLYSTGIPIDARLIFWTASLMIFIENPLLGIGFDNFKFFLPKYTNKAHDFLSVVEYEAMGYTKWSHNELMQLLCETGVLGLFITALVLFYFFVFIKKVRRNELSPHCFFSYLLIFPFIVQSMFSWPLRHPSLLCLFFLFVGSLLTYFPNRSFQVVGGMKKVIRGVAFICLVAILFVGYENMRIGHFFNHYTPSEAKSSFDVFKGLTDRPFLEHAILLEATPIYVRSALQDEDQEFSLKILPYVERLVNLHGSHWQWFNLGLIYHKLNMREKALFAVDQAISLRPIEQKYWVFQHYLNMLTASEKTGRPLRDFLPIPPGGVAEDLEGLFDFHDRVKSRN